MVPVRAEAAQHEDDLMSSSPTAALIALPARDLVFATWANVMLRRGPTTPDRLARSLESVFPLVRVRAQHELAANGPDPIWYAFRDGVYRPGPASEPWRSVDRTVAVIDDEGRIVDAEGSTARIFGLDRASLLGRRLAEFCSPKVRDLADGLMPLVEAARALETRWLFYRASSVTTHVDFVLLCDEAGSHHHLAVVREVSDGQTKPEVVPDGTTFGGASDGHSGSEPGARGRGPGGTAARPTPIPDRSFSRAQRAPSRRSQRDVV
jgi:PAS domain S-box-containing protein